MKFAWSGKSRTLLLSGVIGALCLLLAGCDDAPMRPKEGFYWYRGFRDWWRIPLIYPYQIFIVDSFDHGYFEKYDPSKLVAEGGGDDLIPDITAFAEAGKYWLFRDEKSWFSFCKADETIEEFHSEEELLAFLGMEVQSAIKWLDMKALYRKRWAVVDKASKNLTREFYTRRRNYYGRRIPLRMPWQIVLADGGAFIGKFEVSQAVSDELPPIEQEKRVENIVAVGFGGIYVPFERIDPEKPYGVMNLTSGVVHKFLATREELADVIKRNFADDTPLDMVPVEEFYELMWKAVDHLRENDPKKLGL